MESDYFTTPLPLTYGDSEGDNIDALKIALRELEALKSESFNYCLSIHEACDLSFGFYSSGYRFTLQAQEFHWAKKYIFCKHKS